MYDNRNLENLAFEGIASIEGRLQRKAESVGYIVLQDRTVPRKDETLGRIDLGPHAMSPYLDQILAQDEEDEAPNSWDAEPSEPTPTTPSQRQQSPRHTSCFLADTVEENGKGLHPEVLQAVFSDPTPGGQHGQLSPKPQHTPG